MKTLLAAVLVAVLLPASASAGGYLYLSEANHFADGLTHKLDGRVHLSKCERTSARSATCAVAQTRRGVECRYLVRVSKSYGYGRTSWRARLVPRGCIYVGNNPGDPR